MSNSNKKLKIINEEKYVESLNNIIQRDFFPDLPNLKNQLEWMDAVESNDMDRIKSVQMTTLKRATSVRRGNNIGATPIVNNTGSSSFATPLTDTSFETPTIHNNQILQQQQQQQDNDIDNTNLDSFVNTYISEDDSSYIEIQKKQNEKILLKYKWLFDKADEINKKNQLRLENGNNNNNTLTTTTTNTTSIIEYKSPKDSSTIDTWDYKVKNHLMYKPTPLPNHLLSKEIIGGPPKEILYNNTRITGNLWKDDPKPHATKIVIDKPFSQMTLQEQIEKLKQMESEGHSTMDIESSMLGYLSTPQIIPGRGVDESPIMTWGRVDGTPSMLSSSSSTPFLNSISTPLDIKYRGSSTPSFKIPDTPKREQIANKLYERVAVSKSKSMNQSPKHRSNGSGGITPTLASLSPAAQRLLQKKGGTTPTNLKSPNHIDDQLRKSYSTNTPKPKQIPTNFTPKPIANTSNNNNTPKITTNTSLNTTTTNNNNNSITDNLLDFT